MLDAPARLRDVPWSALRSLAPLLAQPLDAVLSGTPADTVLDRFLRSHPEFSADQRRLASESIFGVGLWRRRLRAQLPPGASSLHLLGSLARDLGGSLSAASDLGVDLPPVLAVADWRDVHSLPDWLAEILTLAVGAEAPALAAALNEPGPISIRVNRSVTTREALIARLADEGRTATPGRWSPDALHITPRPANLTATEAWKAGLFEIQDEGSQLLAMLVPEGGSILDLCAGAGGKTLALASRLPQTALHAVDLDPSRLERLRARAERAKATVHLHGVRPSPELVVDHVLVDAPCSELGALRRGPDRRWLLHPESFAQWPPVQTSLLELAARHLAPNGTITYATCTLRAEENEHVVDAFLNAHAEFHLERPSVASELLHTDGTLRLFPHRQGTDGFFAAVLRLG